MYVQDSYYKPGAAHGVERQPCVSHLHKQSMKRHALTGPIAQPELGWKIHFVPDKITQEDVVAESQRGSVEKWLP